MEYQATLFADDPGSVLAFDRVERVELDRGAWLEIVRGWLPEPDDVFDTLVHRVPWRSGRRQMYDQDVEVPRLLCSYGAGDRLPHPVLARARDALNRHHLPRHGEVFSTVGCALYRDGRDSVAWHGDRIGRGRDQDTLVAIASVGAPRRLALRPRGGGPSFAIEMGHGDLVVMGGSCQRTWDHAVPKQRAAGPRVSIQYRPANVL